MNKKIINASFRKKISIKEQIFFVDRLFFLLKSGAPLIESLGIIEKQIINPKKKVLYRQIIDKVSQGQTLSFSCKDLLNDFGQNLIFTGEQSGFLSVNLGYLSSRLKKNRDLRKNAQQALIYPTFIAFVAIFMTSFLIFFIFPKIIPVIESLNVDLPMTTLFVIAFSNLLSSFWFVILLLAFIIPIIFFICFRKFFSFRLFIYTKIFKVPILGKVYQSLVFSNFCRSISFLLKGGLTFDRSIKITEKSIKNTFLKIKFSEMVSVILRGDKLSDYLLQEKYIFPNDFSSMVSIAEKTGNLEQVFEGLGEYYEYRFSEQIKNLSQMIEPILMIVVGLIVGFIAISMISPIYSITDGLQKI